MTLDISSIFQQCPNVWNELLAAGKMERGYLVLPDHLAAAILSRCPDSPATLPEPRPVMPASPPPLAAPDDVAAQRAAICAGCENNSSGNCRLFGCCNKDLARTVKLALQQCPAGKWGRWMTAGLSAP